MAVAPVSSTSQSAFGLDFQSLLQIILTQLTYQDPLKPLDNFQFVSQLAQFSQLEQSQTLNNSITSLLSAQATTQATGLLGKTIDFTTTGSTSTTSSTASGVVNAVALSSGTPTVTVKMADGSTISNITISQISQIR
jgi:flagellar basal-body rod modification protein FlgD